MKTTKDKLRALTLGASSKFESRTVTVEGNEFEVRQPTVRQRGAIRKAAMKISAGSNGESKADFDISAFQIHAVIALTVCPDTKERVFEDTDIDTFEACPAGGWFDKLGSVAMELCNVSDKELKNDSGKTK